MPSKKDGAKDPKKKPASQVPLDASVPASEKTPAPFEPADTPTSVVSHQSGAVPVEAVGPLTVDLKDKFKAQSIPLQVDFYDLIDVADSGRKAAGLSPEQPGSTGDGLQLDDVKRLAVLATPGKAIDVASSGVGVRANSAKGIEATAGGVGVVANASKGIEATGSGVGVVANTSKGIEATGSGVGVVANARKGIEATGSGVGVVANANKGIEATASGVGVRANSNKGIEATSSGVGVIANAARGIMVNSEGVGVNHDSTLQVINNQLAVAGSVYLRRKVSAVLNLSSMQWRRFATISGIDDMNAYAQLVITAWATASRPYKQRFVVTFCGDWNAHSNSYRSYTLAITNAGIYRSDSGSYATGSIRVGRDAYGTTILEAYLSHTKDTVNYEIGYSSSDVEKVTLHPFDRTQVETVLGTIDPRVNGAIP